MAGVDYLIAGIQPTRTQSAQKTVSHCPVVGTLKYRTGQLGEDRVGLVLSLQPSFLAPVPSLSAPAVQADEDTDERHSRKQRGEKYLGE